MNVSRIKPLVTSLGLALAVAYGAPAKADLGLGDAYLLIDNFTILKGTGNSTQSTTELCFDLFLQPQCYDASGNFQRDITILRDASGNFVQARASTGGGFNNDGQLGGSQTSGSIGGTLSVIKSTGPDAASFVPGTTITVDPTKTFAGAAATASGNSLLAADRYVPNPNVSTNFDASGNLIADCLTGNVFNGTGYGAGCSTVLETAGSTNLTHSQVSLVTPGEGRSESSLSLSSKLVLEAATNTTVEIHFDATRFLRAFLGQPGVYASAKVSDWNITLKRLNANNTVAEDVYEWSPSTPCDVLGANASYDCNSYAQAFNINQVTQPSLTFPAGPNGDNVVRSNSGAFDSEFVLLAGERYQLDITHSVIADAKILPEPGTIALLGLGLMGLGAVARRARR